MVKQIVIVDLLTQINRVYSSLILICTIFIFSVSPLKAKTTTTPEFKESPLSSELYDLGELLILDDLINSCFKLFSTSAATVSTKDSSSNVNGLVISYLTSYKDYRDILDLDDLMYIALQNNQLIEVGKQKWVQNKGQLTQAKSEYLPHLTLEGRYSYTQRKDSASSTSAGGTESESYATSDSSDIEEDDVVHGRVRFSQLVYDFGKTTGAIDIGKSNLDAAGAALQRQVQDIVFQVREAYYNVFEKRRLIDIASESVKSFELHLNRAKVYYKAGTRTRIDVINAEVELSNAKMSLLRANYNLKNARAALEQILGAQPNKGKYVLKNDDVQLDTILETMPVVHGTVEHMTQKAFDQRPDIIQLIRLAEAAEANYGRAKGGYWPSVTIEANYNDYDTELDLYKDSWDVGVAATWQLFSGFHTKGVVSEARGRLLEYRALLTNLKLTVVREVTESFLGADENRESVGIALQTLDLAKENVSLAEKRYKSGTYDVVEFNDAQLSLTRTRNELVATYYGYLTAIAGIEHAIGEKIEFRVPTQYNVQQPVHDKPTTFNEELREDR